MIPKKKITKEDIEQWQKEVDAIIYKEKKKEAEQIRRSQPITVGDLEDQITRLIRAVGCGEPANYDINDMPHLKQESTQGKQGASGANKIGEQ